MIKILRETDYNDLDDLSDFDYDAMASTIIDKLTTKDQLFAKFVEDELDYHSLSALECKLGNVLFDVIKSAFDGQ